MSDFSKIAEAVEMSAAHKDLHDDILNALADILLKHKIAPGPDLGNFFAIVGYVLGCVCAEGVETEKLLTLISECVKQNMLSRGEHVLADRMARAGKPVIN